jgi:filamentous hemagglutinin
LVQSGATLSVKADQLINAGTYTPPAASTTALGLVGQDVQIAANSVNNQSGEVLASHNLTVQAVQSIDNSGGNANSQGGLLYAANALKIQDSALLANPAATRTLQVVNTIGVINAGSSNQVQAAGVTGDGQLLTQGDLSLDVSADFNNSATVNANGNTTVKSAGTIQNSGTISAGKTLTVSAVNLHNAAGGTLSGVDATQVLLSDTLTNRGLIDSGNAAGTSLTLITAQTVNNLGTGRIYGDNIAIGANTLTNDAETVNGVTKAAVIASRNSLDIGVQTLSNNNGATILSLGDMAVGGALDANHRATGDAASVTNSASLIQSVNGNVTINTATLQNLNPTFSYQVVNGTPSAEHTEYILTNGQTVQDSQVAMDNGKLHTYTVANGFTAPYGKVLLSSDPLATATNITIYQEADVATYTQVITGYTGNHGLTPDYATQTSVTAPQNSQIWALVGMAAPANPPPTGIRPADTITTDTGTEHNPAVDVWDAAAAPYIALQNQINAVRTELD